jgi:hypothetical protein
VAAAVSVEPVTVQTGSVLALWLGATANADKGTDVLRIDCPGVLDGYNDSAGWVRIAPHFVAVDPDKPVMKLVRTVIYQADISNDDTPRSVDVDAPKGFDGEGAKATAVECRMHPVFLRDKENAIAGLDDTGGHGRRINVLDGAGCLL